MLSYGKLDRRSEMALLDFCVHHVARIKRQDPPLSLGCQIIVPIPDRMAEKC